MCVHGYLTRRRTARWRANGPSLSPHSAFLLLQGVETLPQRLDEHIANAHTVANWLNNDPRISAVQWAGLADHPHHDRAQQYFPAGPGSVFGFRLAGGENARETGRDRKSTRLN